MVDSFSAILPKVCIDNSGNSCLSVRDGRKPSCCYRPYNNFVLSCSSVNSVGRKTNSKNACFNRFPMLLLFLI